MSLYQLQSQKRKVLPILMASVLLDFVGVGIVLPLLPFYAQSFHASALAISLLLGVYPLLSVFAPALWGSVSDRIGRRPALILNLAGTALSYGLLATANSLEMLFVSRFLAGLSSASIVIVRAYVTDLTTPENRPKTLSLVEAVVGIGFILGPVIGSVLLGSEPENPNFHLPGVVAAMASLVTLAVTLLALPQVKRPPGAIKHRGHIVAPRLPALRTIMRAYRDMQRTCRRPLLGPLLVWVFITMFVSVGVQVIFPLWCSQRFGWGAQQYGYLVVFFSLFTAILQIGLTGRLIQTLGEQNLALLSIGSAALGLFLISLSTSVLQFFGAVIFSIFAQATCIPTLTSLVSQLAGPNQQGKTLGLMQSTAALAGFLGSVWVGLAFDMLGANWPLWINGGLLIISFSWGWYRVSSDQLSAVMAQRYRQKLNYLFNILDRDHNGTIELNDFEQASHQLATFNGWSKDSHDYVMLQRAFLGLGKTLQQLADDDHDGKIYQTEWFQLFQSNVDDDFANQFFKLIDTNQDGLISTDELKRFYQTYEISTDNIEDVCHILAFDQAGYLSKAKFSERFIQFIYSQDLQVPGLWLFGSHLPKQL